MDDKAGKRNFSSNQGCRGLLSTVDLMAFLLAVLGTGTSVIRAFLQGSHHRSKGKLQNVSKAPVTHSTPAGGYPSRSKTKLSGSSAPSSSARRFIIITGLRSLGRIMVCARWTLMGNNVSKGKVTTG